VVPSEENLPLLPHMRKNKRRKTRRGQDSAHRWMMIISQSSTAQSGRYGWIGLQ